MVREPVTVMEPVTVIESQSHKNMLTDSGLFTYVTICETDNFR